MGENTGIEWAHHTHNEWWGCEKISPGCKNCYASTWDERFPQNGETHWGKNAPRRFFGEKHTNKPLGWNKRARERGVRERVFSGSMNDWAEDRDDLIPHRRHMFQTIAKTPNLDWLLLSKRPWNFERFLPWMGGNMCTCGEEAGHCSGVDPTKPWPNVWLGTSAENQEEWERRRPHLRNAPAVVTFVSYEPALEHVDFGLATGYQDDGWKPTWLISGAESGEGARPAQLDWFRSARDQCEEASVDYFFKQLVTNNGKKKVSLPLLDGRQHAVTPRYS